MVRTSRLRRSREISAFMLELSINGCGKNASKRARNLVPRVPRMLSFVSFANATSSSNKKWKCSDERPRIFPRRISREKALPARNRARRRRDPRRGVVPGFKALTPALLPLADRTAWKLCRDQGWWSAFGKKKARGKGRKPGPAVHDDLVQREFAAAVPNELWLSDITEHWTSEGKLYLCAVKDMWSKRIVGYSIDAHMTSALAVTALNNAVLRRGDVSGCVLHTDRGSQFRSRKIRRALTVHGMAGSMGRVGAAGDNTAMESFFSLLQKNVLNRRTWATRDELRLAIVTWIERTYHRRRRQARLGRLAPVEYEAIMNKQVALAA